MVRKKTPGKKDPIFETKLTMHRLWKKKVDGVSILEKQVDGASLLKKK